MANKAEAYLHKKKNSVRDADVAEHFQTLENYYVQKLWHQLTLQVRKLVYDTNFANAVDLKEFYDNFIQEFQHRVNALQIVEISMQVARHIFKKDKKAAFDFLEGIRKVVSKDKEASVRVSTGEIELHLADRDAEGKVADITLVRKLVEDTEKEVDALVGVTPVHAPFYKVSSAYLKEIGDHAAYYREALRYIGCENIDQLAPIERQTLATLLSVAALLGDGIYNFGELLSHPILDALKGTENAFLIDVLFACNAGDIVKFRQFEKQLSKWSDVVQNREKVEGKIRLLCLMEIALARPSKERYIPFNEVAQKALVNLNDVEFLVMKALSKGLVSGSIDQVNATVNITWVQPRVLSSEQIGNMADRVGAWRADVESMESVVRDNAKEIIMKA
ncbi:PCI domain containing protein [Aphelenchoides avenae]|nr:PCI domain containing protein [Aphelenchus avenae]